MTVPLSDLHARLLQRARARVNTWVYTEIILLLSAFFLLGMGMVFDPVHSELPGPLRCPIYNQYALKYLHAPPIIGSSGTHPPVLPATKRSAVRYAQPLIQASVFALREQAHPLTPLSLHLFALDVGWVAAHPLDLRYFHGAAQPFSKAALDKLVFRLSLEIPASLQTRQTRALSKDFAQVVVAKTRAASSTANPFFLLSGVLGVVFLVMTLIRRRMQAIVIRSCQIWDPEDNPGLGF